LPKYFTGISILPKNYGIINFDLFSSSRFDLSSAISNSSFSIFSFVSLLLLSSLRQPSVRVEKVPIPDKIIVSNAIAKISGLSRESPDLPLKKGMGKRRGKKNRILHQKILLY
jgi:hypothetical protein